VEQLDLTETLRELEGEMVEAAKSLQFERAAVLRDQIRELKHRLNGAELKSPGTAARAVQYDKKAKRGGRRKS
jgi:excinuclease ABC subunit B